MYEGVLNSVVPILMALIYIIFICVSILVAVRPPTGSEEEPIPAKLYPRWGHLERRAGRVEKRVIQRVKPKTKAKAA